MSEIALEPGAVALADWRAIYRRGSIQPAGRASRRAPPPLRGSSPGASRSTG